MDRIEYRTLDKSDWARGPWDDEPDKVQFYDDETGLPCLIVRGPHGALCGYVGVRPGHPWHKVDYDDVKAAEADEEGYSYVSVHGGLTFAAGCQHGDDPSKGICHIPAPGDTDDVWWLGFDCAHAGDLTGMNYPSELRLKMRTIFDEVGLPRDTYRDVAYVEANIRDLAAEAARVEKVK